MIAYEVEQRFIRDIMWLDKTKAGVVQRNERQAAYRREREEREAEREKRQKAYEEIQEKRRLEEIQRQKDREVRELKRVQENPYTGDIEMCEFLIKYCDKTFKQFSKAADLENNTDHEEEAANAEAKAVLDDFKAKGKV